MTNDDTTPNEELRALVDTYRTAQEIMGRTGRMKKADAYGKAADKLEAVIEE